MAMVTVILVALVASALTFFSGFGLGTLLMPAFALFFPVEVAVVATAVVHLLNNVFKLWLVRTHIHYQTLWRFAIPAAGAAFIGAWMLTGLSQFAPLHVYTIGERICEITMVKLLVGILMAGFALLELSPAYEKLEFHPRYLPLGGIIAGLFGGLSGHQGALRSAFLVRVGLSKEQFIATGVASAVIVDLSRILIYGLLIVGSHWDLLRENDGIRLVVFASLAAFGGSLIGSMLLKKITLRTVRLIIGGMLLMLAIAMISGLI